MFSILLSIILSNLCLSLPLILFLSQAFLFTTLHLLSNNITLLLGIGLPWLTFLVVLSCAGLEWTGVAGRRLNGPGTAASTQPDPCGVQPWPAHTWNATGVSPHSPVGDLQGLLQCVVTADRRHSIPPFVLSSARTPYPLLFLLLPSESHSYNSVFVCLKIFSFNFFFV